MLPVMSANLMLLHLSNIRAIIQVSLDFNLYGLTRVSMIVFTLGSDKHEIDLALNLSDLVLGTIIQEWQTAAKAELHT